MSSREIVGEPLVEFPGHSNICKRLKQLVMGDRVEHLLNVKEDGCNLAVGTEVVVPVSGDG